MGNDTKHMAENNPKYIVVHCSDISYKVSKDQLRSINNYHRDVRGFPLSTMGYYVGYHALITGGKVVRTRQDWEEGAHCNQVKNGISMNLQSLGICIGFDGDIEYPTKEDQELLRQQIVTWQEKYDIARDCVFFHRDFAKDKTCPGAFITRAWLDTIVIDRKQKALGDLVVEKKTVEKFLELLRKLGIIK